MKTIYFEDIQPGDIYWGDAVDVDPEEMLEYNKQNDPWPIHVDEDAARQSPFGGIIASGGYTITLMYRSLIGAYNNSEVQWKFLGGLDWQAKFLGPVRPGDRLKARITINSVRPSSKGNRGVLNSTTDVLNQSDEIVMSLDIVSFVAGRPDR